MMPRFFAAYSVDEASRPIPPGAPKPIDLERSIAALPMASLKHIARAAQIAADDPVIRSRIDVLILQNDARSLGRFLETLGTEGKLGASWSPEDFLSARGIKRGKSRAGRRMTRRRLETSVDILRRRAILIGRRIARKLLSADDLLLLARFDGASGIGRCERRGYSYEALDNLDEMIGALPHVKPVDPRTWSKLAELPSLRARAEEFLAGG